MGACIDWRYHQRVKLAKVIAENVRNRRLALEMSQETLAEKARFGTRYLQDLEAGVRNNLMLATIQRLAVSLKTEPHLLLTPHFFPKQAEDRAPRKAALTRTKRGSRQKRSMP